jgi:hypothetical protein
MGWTFPEGNNINKYNDNSFIFMIFLFLLFCFSMGMLKGNYKFRLQNQKSEFMTYDLNTFIFFYIHL